MEARATPRYLRVSPRKIRLILDLVKGKTVDEALSILRFVPSPHARKVAKVIRSAAANAENNFNMDPRTLRIVRAYADEGPRLKRYRPQARGRVNPIKRRMSHVTIVVEGER